MRRLWLLFSAKATKNERKTVMPCHHNLAGYFEALSSGVSVAAYPVRGPIDIIRKGETGSMDEDLGKAVRKALTIDRNECREFALSHG